MNWIRLRLLREGPTDLLAVMRIGLALLLWTRFGMQVAPFYRPNPYHWMLGAVFFPATAMMLIGWFTRTSTAVVALTLGAMWLYFGPNFGMVDEFDHHHTRLLYAAVALMTLTPSGRSWSMDRWLAVRKARGLGLPFPSTHGPLWATDLIALQVSTTYIWSAWDKSQWAFLSGERLQHMALRWYLFDYPDWVWFPAACLVAAWITVILEYVLPVALFIPRFQKVLIPAGLLLHGVFFVLLPVGTFSCTMMLLYLAYIEPAPLLRALADMTGSTESPPPPPHPSQSPTA